MLSLATGPGSLALVCDVYARSRKIESRTFFERSGQAPLAEEWATAPPYRTLSWVVLQLPLATRERYVSPTSATDLHHEHPSIVWLPNLRLAPQRPPLAFLLKRKPQRKDEKTTSDHRKAIRPRVERRLTAALQLQPIRSQRSFTRRRRAPLRAALPWRDVISRVQGPAIRPLTLSVAPSCPPDESSFFIEGTRIASTAPSSKGATFPIQSAFHQQVPQGTSLARAGARHRSRSLAAGEPASGALSPSECSRTERLDPSTVAWAIHPWSRGPRTACWLLQPIRPTSTTAESTEPCAFALLPLGLPQEAATSAGGYAPFGAQPAEKSRARGRHGKPRPAPFTAIACDESFTPTRSAQTPPVANSL